MTRALTPAPMVSALFSSSAAAERALATLEASGMPRDLLELAVSEAGAKEHYAGRVRRAPARETLRYAGIGGLIGLALGAGVALLLLMLPGRTELTATIVSQLLGPNVSTLLGAAIGALIGYLVRRRLDVRLSRVLDAGSAVLLAARARSEEEASALESLLRSCGGTDVRSDPSG